MIFVFRIKIGKRAEEVEGQKGGAVEEAESREQIEAQRRSRQRHGICGGRACQETVFHLVGSTIILNPYLYFIFQ